MINKADDVYALILAPPMYLAFFRAKKSMYNYQTILALHVGRWNIAAYFLPVFQQRSRRHAYICTPTTTSFQCFSGSGLPVLEEQRRGKTKRRRAARQIREHYLRTLTIAGNTSNACCYNLGWQRAERSPEIGLPAWIRITDIIACKIGTQLCYRTSNGIDKVTWAYGLAQT